MRTLVTMSLPLGQQKRQDRELELAKLLATGRQIAGAIVFSSKYDMFEFLRSSGDTEVPLDMQIPELRLHDRELGPSVRCKTFSLHYMKSDIGYYVRLFVRVIVGCPDVQIQGVVQYLNNQMRGNTLPAKFERYDELVWLCRCVLHPDYKFFTRLNKLKPYVWVPMPRPETKDVMTLADVVLHGDSRTAVQVTLPSARDKWPEVGQVRRTEPLAANPTETETRPPQAEVAATVTGEIDSSTMLVTGPPAIPAAEDGFESEDMFATQEETPSIAPGSPVVEPEQQSENDKTVTSETQAAVYSEVQDEVCLVAESTKGPDADSQAGVETELLDQPGRPTVVENTANQPESNVSSTPSASLGMPESELDKDNNNVHDISDEVVVSDQDDEMKDKNDEDPADNVGKDNETESSPPDPILSGDVFGPNVPKANAQDSRSLSLRRLHDELPRTKSGIPDHGKDKIAFTKLVHDIRKLEMAYYKEHKMEMVLTSLNPDKLLNKREAARELRHLHNLMSDRDVWLQDQAAAAAKDRLAEVKKANTKKGRMLKKRAIEAEEGQRLSDEGATGFALFAKLRREREARAEEEATEVEDRSTPDGSGGGKKPKKTTLLSQALARQSDPNADVSSSDAESLSRNNSISGIDGTRGRNRKGCSVGFSALSETFDEIGGNNGSQNELPEDSFAKPAIPKVDGSKSYQIMKELYRFTTAHSAEVLKLHDKHTAQLKALAKEQQRGRESMARLGENLRLLQKAFFDYDCQAHNDLCDVETELHAYLPVNELGEKTDFVFTNPATARTVVKHVRNTLLGEGVAKPSLTKLVNAAASECFSAELRAHMHIVKRQKKQCANNLGWWRVACPDSFQTMVEKYLLPLCPNLNPTQRTRGWKERLYSHFTNAGYTYFNSQAAATSSQKAFILERYRLRRELQGMHFKPEVEGHELVIPSLKVEEENYVRYSDNYDRPQDLETSEKTQRSQNNTLPKAKPPLPPMAELRDLAKRLQEALDASTVARKGQKRKMALAMQGNEALWDSDDDTIAISNSPDDLLAGDNAEQASLDDGVTTVNNNLNPLSRNLAGKNGQRNTSFRSNDSVFNFDPSLVRHSSVNSQASTSSSAVASAPKSSQGTGKITKLSSQYKRAKKASQE